MVLTKLSKRLMRLVRNGTKLTSQGAILGKWNTQVIIKQLEGQE